MNPKASKQSKSWALLEPFRRVTSTGRFIPEIDGLRFIAIFAVYLYHLAGDVMRRSSPDYAAHLRADPLFRMTEVLNVGVPLFFVISGFILSLPFAEAHRNLRKHISLKDYFWRRATRLEPPYFLCLFLFFALKIVASKGTFQSLLPNLAASLLYVHNLVFGRPSDINFVAWSLEVEIQFYILAPLLSSVFAITSASTRRAVLVVGVLLATGASALVTGRLQLSLLSYAQYFLTGFLLAEFYLDGVRAQKSYLWDAVSIAGWSALLFLLVQGKASWLAPWLILLLYIATFLGPTANRIITNPWIATIGGMCYSIYLLHNYIIAGLGSVTQRFASSAPFAARLLLQFVLMTPIALTLSALYFRFIERPCMGPWLPRRAVSAYFARLSGSFREALGAGKAG